jgi:adenosylcobinamide-GDP ribazoletransferase
VPTLRHNLSRFGLHCSLALHRATRLRLHGSLAPPAEPDADMLRASAVHLPGAGWVIGLAACLSFAIVALALRGNPWGPAVAAVASMMATLYFTRAQQERALAGATEPLVLYLVLAGKITVLAAIAAASEPAVVAVLFAGPVVSLATSLLVAHWLEADGRHEPARLRTGGLWAVIPLLLLVPAAGVAALVAALVLMAAAAILMYRYCRRRELDAAAASTGAVQQVCELAFYFGAAIAVR